MFGDHFYHSIIRKTVAVFGTLFNDVKVVRRGASNVVESMIKIPLSYGPKQKFLARLDQELDLDTDAKLALKLPRMSFEITGFNYDASVKQSSFNKLNINQDTGDTQAIVRNGVPYNIDFQLNIMAKNQDDALQILEQILPNFQPTYNVAVKYLEGIENSFDLPITLNSISFTDDYEGDFVSRRLIMYTLDFTTKVKFFGNVETSKVIRQVYTNFIDNQNLDLIEMVQVQTNPVSARKDDVWDIETAVYFIPTNLRFQLDFSGLINFQVGETIVGETSGAVAVIVSVDQDSASGETRVIARDPDAYFIRGETVTGDLSTAQGAIFDYEVLT